MSDPIEQQPMTNQEQTNLSSKDSDFNLEDIINKASKKKHKILFLSDHPLSASGVGVQARFLINGLVETGKYTFKCLGGAIKHTSYETVQVNPDFIVKPIDGFGDRDTIRKLLVAEKPDAIFLFTDPRQFIWIWEMEDEIRSICPIVYWHVWDNDPYPDFNAPWYESTDLINCISKKTFDLVKPNFPDKTNYVPHSFPKSAVTPLPKEQIISLRQKNFVDKSDWFTALWVNRNATRKMPADLINGFANFVNELEKKHGHRKATLIMHTDPSDIEGPNLIAVAERFGVLDNVLFSKEKLGFEQMNALYNIVDVGINISKNEGFGLLVLNLLQAGKPVIALKTGGMTEQIQDAETGYEFGVAIEPAKRALVGSQLVPYIYEDYCTQEQIASAFMKLYEMSPEERETIGKNAIAHVEKNFNYENMINMWDVTLEKTIKEHQNKLTSRWSVTPLQVKLKNVPKKQKVNSQLNKNINNTTVVDKQVVTNKQATDITINAQTPVNNKINNDKETLRNKIKITPVSL
jgi:glycosyltransferase involved in cell wall biosynthesis